MDSSCSWIIRKTKSFHSLSLNLNQQQLSPVLQCDWHPSLMDDGPVHCKNWYMLLLYNINHLSVVFQRYRKVLSNNCMEAGRNVYSPKRQACRPRPPRGLRLSTGQGELSAPVGSNVTFMVYLEDVSHIISLQVTVVLFIWCLLGYFIQIFF